MYIWLILCRIAFLPHLYSFLPPLTFLKWACQKINCLAGTKLFWCIKEEGKPTNLQQWHDSLVS
jgi:hypothetical protein